MCDWTYNTLFEIEAIQLHILQREIISIDRKIDVLLKFIENINLYSFNKYYKKPSTV